jgi:glycogen debranching enzyme
MRFRDGRIAEPPIAPCEAQGYVYDAKLRAARLAREVWDDERLARTLCEQAAELRVRFNEAFWVEDRACFALALDREKRPVDSITSNVGHLLWSGIVEPGRAPMVAAHLTGSHLFTGFGLRTMSTLDDGFNPIGYHVGTVWPHDTAIAAAGLARYEFRDAAASLAAGLVGAAQAFGGRLPEAFAGYPASLTRLPVEYPTSAAPQAWAAGSLLLLLRALLGLEPSGQGFAVLPESIGAVSICGMPVRGELRDVHAGGGLRGQVAGTPAP